MNYLVDTHIFLWTVFSPQYISKTIKDILLNPEQIKYISIISFWEISLKFSLKKINLTGILPDALPAIAIESGFEILPLEITTVASFYKLPKLGHKDPFDRMLAWQAIEKNYVLLTKDKEFDNYKKYGLQLI